MQTVLPDTLEQAHQQIMSLRFTLACHTTLPARLGLSIIETRIVAALIEAEMLTKVEMEAAASCGRPNYHLSDQCLNTHVSRLRGKLKPFGLSIITVFGEGWKMTAGDRAKCRAMLVGDRD